MIVPRHRRKLYGLGNRSDIDVGTASCHKIGRLRREGVELGDVFLGRTPAEREGRAPGPVMTMDGLAQLTTVDQVARERGIDPAKLGYRSRGVSKASV